jgi:hypothetical protein
VQEVAIFTANILQLFTVFSFNHVLLFLKTIHSFNFVIKHYKLYAKSEFIWKVYLYSIRLQVADVRCILSNLLGKRRQIAIAEAFER